MSRLCRLKTASHGEDGKWAYAEIVRLRAENETLRKDAERYRAIKRWDGAIRDGEAAANIRLYGLQGDAEEALLAAQYDDLDAAIDAAMKGE